MVGDRSGKKKYYSEVSDRQQYVRIGTVLVSFSKHPLT